MASGEIVAYTDDDCVADEHWLRYLVQAMQDQQVEAIGGPNITPESDGWIAKCVAASPGNPSHVMLDDTHAEHVPGCNMAFRRSTLLGIGGFDPQFRAAGDDVDICWRLLDADLPIGYAPGAMVWHHRRATVKAYAKQQKGYGRSEALVHFKHPQRCGVFGRSSWRGIIYGDGAVGLPLRPQIVYHGQFGGGLFQTIYRHNHYGVWAVIMSLEWHFAAAFLLLLSTLYWPLAGVSAVMWLATAVLAIRSAWQGSAAPFGAVVDSTSGGLSVRHAADPARLASANALTSQPRAAGCFQPLEGASSRSQADLRDDPRHLLGERPVSGTRGIAAGAGRAGQAARLVGRLRQRLGVLGLQIGGRPLARYHLRHGHRRAGLAPSLHAGTLHGEVDPFRKGLNRSLAGLVAGRGGQRTSCGRWRQAAWLAA